MGGAANDSPPQRRKCPQARSLSGGRSPAAQRRRRLGTPVRARACERTTDNRARDYLSEVAASSRHQHIVLTSGQFHRPRSPEQGFPSGGARRGGHDEH